MKDLSSNRFIAPLRMLLAAGFAVIGLLFMFSAAADPSHPGRGIGDFIPVLDIAYEPNIYGLDPSEDVTISPRGNIYIGMNVGGEVYKYDRFGNMSLLADFVDNVDDAYVTGLSVDAEENVYVCVWGFFVPEVNGVWRIPPGGSPEHILPIPGDFLGSIPNSLAFDRDGNLYMTDSGAGAIYRLTPDGQSSLWLQDDLLESGGPGGFGANGIEFRRDSLWVANFDLGTIIEVPILPDGSPGAPDLFAESALLWGIDGFSFDVLGNMYAVVLAQGTLVRVSPEADIEVLLTPADTNDALIINPVFGFRHDHSTLFISGEFPHLGKVDVGIPGMRLPQFRGRYQH